MWRLPIRPKLNLIQLKNIPIFEQLQLEEALLRTSKENFCIINQGSPKAIVMGISGEPEKLIHLESAKKESIPIIKRFSGGGTVIIDESTLFITFIIAKGALDITPFPEPILRWSAELYQDSWQIPNFHLRENDYCIGDKKCGGNAQYIQKDRWLHHTSFLWDYCPNNMKHLKLPEKRPKYRLGRQHTDFLTKLNAHAKNSKQLIENLKTALVKQLYISDFDLGAWEKQPHRQAAKVLNF